MAVVLVDGILALRRCEYLERARGYREASVLWIDGLACGTTLAGVAPAGWSGSIPTRSSPMATPAVLCRPSF